MLCFPCASSTPPLAPHSAAAPYLLASLDLQPPAGLPIDFVGSQREVGLPNNRGVRFMTTSRTPTTSLSDGNSHPNYHCKLRITCNATGVLGSLAQPLTLIFRCCLNVIFKRTDHSVFQELRKAPHSQHKS